MKSLTAGSCSLVSAELGTPSLHKPFMSLASILGVGVVGFCICTIPKIHYHVMLVSTAFVGATAVMLGVDCYTAAGLKEVSKRQL